MQPIQKSNNFQENTFLKKRNSLISIFFKFQFNFEKNRKGEVCEPWEIARDDVKAKKLWEITEKMIEDKLHSEEVII